MKSRRIFWLALPAFAAAITACQPGEPVGTSVSNTPEPPPVELLKEVPEAPVPVTPADTSDLEVPDQPVQAPLNLELSPDILVVDETADELNFLENGKLPGLFDADDSSRVSASVRLLLDKENPEPIKSVDGLEISIKKTL